MNTIINYGLKCKTCNERKQGAVWSLEWQSDQEGKIWEVPLGFCGSILGE